MDLLVWNSTIVSLIFRFYITFHPHPKYYYNWENESSLHLIPLKMLGEKKKKMLETVTFDLCLLSDIALSFLL